MDFLKKIIAVLLLLSFLSGCFAISGMHQLIGSAIIETAIECGEQPKRCTRAPTLFLQ